MTGFDVFAKLRTRDDCASRISLRNQKTSVARCIHTEKDCFKTVCHHLDFESLLV